MATDNIGPVSSGPRQMTAELPQPVLQTTGNRALIEVFSQQQVGTCEGLVVEASAVAITDRVSFDRAQATLVRLHDALKAVEARRVELKKPITQIGKSIDEIAAKLADPMDSAKRSLQGKVIAHQKLIDAEAAKQRAEAEEKARQENAERQRLHDIAVAEARAKAEAEAKEVEALLGAPVEVVEPVIAKPLVSTAVVMPQHVAPPSVLQSRVVKKLEITDPSLIPYRVGEQVLMNPDHGAIKRLLGLGINVPGCRLVDEEQVAMAGRRA
ncbi:MAG TPA: hypothetical protein VEL07_19420 [Planctomycetota bacterium]|nr:hypothetical protein [Planctomycetota bacterium]